MIPDDADPRNGQFEQLHISYGMGSSFYDGPWTFRHLGFGQHGFVNSRTGDFVPVTSVVQAYRTAVQ